jgi:predicted transcriptional regulator
MGVVQYHIYKLEKEGGIVSRRRGLYKRFYPNVKFDESQLEILDILSQETERDILLYLIRNPEAIQKELSEYVGTSPASINWHMRRLSRTGLVETKRVGPNVRYFVRGDHREILALLQSYHPMIWERWADRLAEVLIDISESRTEETSRGE